MYIFMYGADLRRRQLGRLAGAGLLLFMPKKPPTHRPPGYAPEAERKKEYDRLRSRLAYRKLYNYKWAKAAQSFRRRNPLCAQCLREGRTGTADVVDHIIAHKGDVKLFWDKENWQSLCVYCHNKKSPTER